MSAWDGASDQVRRGTPIVVFVALAGTLLVGVSAARTATTREIGMLRSVGARARDVRRIFIVEELTIALTLVGTIVVTLLVVLAPVRRAVRLKPGDALRYA